MTEDEKKAARAAELDAAIKAADKKRADDEAAAGKSLDTKLSNVLDAVTGMSDAVAQLGKRLDAIEKGSGRKPFAEQPGQDLLDGDLSFDELPAGEQDKLVGEEMEREPTKARELAAHDAARHYADSIRSMSRLDRDLLKERVVLRHQAALDSVFNELGQRAPAPLASEGPRAYRTRLLRALSRHSPSWKNADLSKIADAKAFAAAEIQIVADARAEAAKPTNIGPGELRMVERRQDQHIIRTFHGSPDAWMGPMAGLVMRKATGNWKTGRFVAGDN